MRPHLAPIVDGDRAMQNRFSLFDLVRRQQAARSRAAPGRQETGWPATKPFLLYVPVTRKVILKMMRTLDLYATFWIKKRETYFYASLVPYR